MAISGQIAMSYGCEDPFKGAFDAVEIDGVRYLADTERYPSDRQSLVVVKNG